MTLPLLLSLRSWFSSAISNVNSAIVHGAGSRVRPRQRPRISRQGMCWRSTQACSTLWRCSENLQKKYPEAKASVILGLFSAPVDE